MGEKSQRRCAAPLPHNAFARLLPIAQRLLDKGVFNAETRRRRGAQRKSKQGLAGYFLRFLCISASKQVTLQSVSQPLVLSRAISAA
jgi:hypothetical protein